MQLIMDEPPEALYNQWIRDRIEYYKRVECLRFSSVTRDCRWRCRGSVGISSFIPMFWMDV